MNQVRLIPACPSSRLIAWIIDSAITIAIMMAVIFQRSGELAVDSFLWNAGYADLAMVIGSALGIQLLLLGTIHRSIGMYAADLQILKNDGERATWSNVVRRPLGLLGLLATVGLSALLPYLNENRRTLADYVSDTRVVESPAIGTPISYDPWRIFKSLLKTIAPIGMAVAMVVLLISNKSENNKAIFMDAFVITVVGSFILALVVTGLKVKATRVRIGPQGIHTSSWLGWSGKPIEWDTMDYAQIRLKRLFPYFEIHKQNRGKLRVPMEHNSAQLAAQSLVQHGVRIE